MTLYAFRNPRVTFPAFEAGVVGSGRAVSENSCIHGRYLFRESCLQELVHSRQVFVRGGSPRTRAAVFSRRVFD